MVCREGDDNPWTQFANYFNYYFAVVASCFAIVVGLLCTLMVVKQQGTKNKTLLALLSFIIVYALMVLIYAVKIEK